MKNGAKKIGRGLLYLTTAAVLGWAALTSSANTVKAQEIVQASKDNEYKFSVEMKDGIVEFKNFRLPNGNILTFIKTDVRKELSKITDDPNAIKNDTLVNLDNGQLRYYAIYEKGILGVSPALDGSISWIGANKTPDGGPILAIYFTQNGFCYAASTEGIMGYGLNGYSSATFAELFQVPIKLKSPEFLKSKQKDEAELIDENLVDPSTNKTIKMILRMDGKTISPEGVEYKKPTSSGE